MVAVNSTMLPLGTLAADFSLADTRDESTMVSREDVAGKPMLIMFICNHCPYVLHIANEMAQLGNWAQQQGFTVLAISANDPHSYPQDGPDKMAQFAQQYDMRFPYLYDETQDVAKAYKAACTPDFYVFDQQHRLQYRGQMDGARPGNDVTVDGRDLRAAIEAVLAGKLPNEKQTASIGCNIKWKRGNEPDYF